MGRKAIYTEMLEQALSLPLKVDLDDHAPELTARAEALADELYRLCIEFGVEYNDFKKSVLDEALDRSRLSKVQKGRLGPMPKGSFLVSVEEHLPVVILALELMRDDTDF